jgi:hypothetical protein
MPGMLVARPQRHDVAGGGGCCPGLGLGLSEDGGGEGELGDLMAQVADLLTLRGASTPGPLNATARLNLHPRPEPERRT